MIRFQGAFEFDGDFVRVFDENGTLRAVAHINYIREFLLGVK